MKYIIESIQNYVEKENTNYAILLNGKWGSGKTYFWENFIKPKVEQMVINNKEQKTIYVSLYGIGSIDDINKKIVLDSLTRKMQLAKKLEENKWGGRITELAKMSLGVLKGLEIPVLKEALDTSINYENLLDFTDTVICFDDLERANIPITDILGYINSFVEHDGVKTIIIGNEEEISQRLITKNIEMKMLVSSIVLNYEGKFNGNKGPSNMNEDSVLTESLIADKLLSLFNKDNNYKRIKEKLIGKTLTYNPTPSELIRGIINQVSNTDLKLFLEENIEVVISTFTNSKVENIRILKQAMEDFEIVYLAFKQKDNKYDSDILVPILKFILAISFEIKTGSMMSEELENVSSNEHFLSSLTGYLIAKRKTKSHTQLFKEKYFATDNSYKIPIFFKFAEILVRKGIFHTELFERELEKYRADLTDNTPVTVKLLKEGYWWLSDEDFPEVIIKAYQELIEGKVPFISYYRAYEMFEHLIEKGLFKKDIKILKKELLMGLGLASQDNDIMYDERLSMYFKPVEEEDQNLLEFKNAILKINEEKKQKKLLEEIQILIKQMNLDFNKFLTDVFNKYSYMPIFSYCNVEELFGEILALDNTSTISFTQLLERRYENQEDIPRLSADEEKLKLLKDKIDSYVYEKKITLKISLLKDLSSALGVISKTFSQQASKDVTEV